VAGLGEEVPKCRTCSKPATCIGEYETCTGVEDPACDDCCGHGNEDGHCRLLTVAPEQNPSFTGVERGPLTGQSAQGITTNSRLGRITAWLCVFLGYTLLEAAFAAGAVVSAHHRGAVALRKARRALEGYQLVLLLWWRLGNRTPTGQAPAWRGRGARAAALAG
jgi:hypothetical protein